MVLGQATALTHLSLTQRLPDPAQGKPESQTGIIMGCGAAVSLVREISLLMSVRLWQASSAGFKPHSTVSPVCPLVATEPRDPEDPHALSAFPQHNPKPQTPYPNRTGARFTPSPVYLTSSS